MEFTKLVERLQNQKFDIIYIIRLFDYLAFIPYNIVLIQY